MNSRERVIAGIEHREPDRVPIDMGSNPSSGISVITYNKLKKFLRIESGHSRIYDVVQQLAQPEDEILKRFNTDIIDIGRIYNSDDNDWYEIELSDGSKAEYPKWFNPELQEDGSYNTYNENNELLAKMPANSAFFSQVPFPYINGYPDDYKNLSDDMNKVLWSAYASSPWDHSNDAGFWDDLREKCRSLRDNTDYALLISCGCNLFQWGTFLRRMDNFLTDLAMDQKNVEKLLDALMEKHLNTLQKVCSSAGDIVDIIRFDDDLGMNNGPFMSPETYKKIFKPRHAMLCDYVKKNSNMKTFLHSCGSIYKLLPDLIEAGYEIINPVETNLKDMNPEKLKKEFGNDITFWGGGIDTANILNNGTPEDVKNDIKRRLEIFSPGGGYIFNTIHNILPNVPPENIAAMFDAVHDFKRNGSY